MQVLVWLAFFTLGRTTPKLRAPITKTNVFNNYLNAVKGKKQARQTNQMAHRWLNVQITLSWVKLLRMQGDRLPTTQEVTGLNPGPSKNYSIIEKYGIPDSL